MNCHQGRQSKYDVDGRAEGLGPDEISDQLSFRNIHYFAAGATLFGTEVQGGYEYAGKEHVGRFEHVAGFQGCIECHDAHGLAMNAQACAGCHGTDDPHAITMADYDGGGEGESVAEEIHGLEEALYAAMQAYAESNADTAPIVYDTHAYPYFFDDAGERYATRTPRLLRAAYNYQYAAKDPGGFAHNGKYVINTFLEAPFSGEKTLRLASRKVQDVVWRRIILGFAVGY